MSRRSGARILQPGETNKILHCAKMLLEQRDGICNEIASAIYLMTWSASLRAADRTMQ